MKGENKTRAAKIIAALVLLIGVGVVVVVAVNIDTGNKIGKVDQNETDEVIPRDDSSSKKAEESRTEAKGVTTAKQASDESGGEVVYAVDAGFGYVDIGTSMDSGNEVAQATDNDSGETEAERIAREAAKKAAREEAERLAKIEEMLAMGGGGYSGVDDNVNDYPWQNECPRENRPPAVSFIGERIIGGYQCECVSYAAWKVYQKYGVVIYWGNAYSWDESARMANYRVDNISAAGAVGQVDKEPYGHVFWVESVNEDGSIKITEYNNPYSTYLYSGESRKQDFGVRIISAEGAAQFDYIHFEDLTKV